MIFELCYIEVIIGDKHIYASSNSSLCQNGKQVEIITKMIFELCYIEAILLYKTIRPTQEAYNTLKA